MCASIVHVDMNLRGAWEVELPDDHSPMICESLDDAKRLARLCAQRRRPCELVVRDAYHRVLVREVIQSATDQTSRQRGGVR